MATAATSAPSLEVTAPDIMDLHSDSGLDFGDGDIDLDLRSTGGLDDDVSLLDAATDPDLDIQTGSADQDDFMVDNEDLIEEDIVNYNDDVVVDTDQNSMANVGEEHDTTNLEDELIDYSDDDGHLEHDTAPDTLDAQADTASTEVENEDTVVELSSETAEAVVGNDPSHDYEQGDAVYLHGSPNVDQEGGLYADLQPEEDIPQHEEQSHVDVNDDVKVDALGETTPVKEVPNVEDESVVAGTPTAVAAPAEEASHVRQDAPVHRVTINYDGAELWLFKHHDLEESGDYLIEDDSLANKPISSILDSCRVALGSDISDHMEVGFRLDNFRNIELYQEHSACAFVTLDHIVSIYLQLHAQDGTMDPESFYMTLLFRPRVSALLNELNKAAAEGIGHTGLSNAIAAGRTSFTAEFSHESTEQTYNSYVSSEQQQEHDLHSVGGENEQEGHEEQEENNESHNEVDEESYEEYDEQPEGQDEEDVENRTEPSVQTPEKTAAVDHADAADSASNQAYNESVADDAEPASQPVADQSRDSSTGASQSNPQDEDDLIDYSDEEGDAEANNGEQVSNQPSSSSSTVQGDDTLFAPDKAEDFADQSHFAQDDDEVTYAYQDDEVNEAFAQNEGFDLNQEEPGDQSYGEEYNVGDDTYDPGFTAAGELEEFSGDFAQQANYDDTNQYDDFGDQTVEQSADFASNEDQDEVQSNVAQSTTVDDNFTGADDFLDFDNAVEAADVPAKDEAGDFTAGDEIDYDDEDGAVSQAPVAASAGSDPVAASSSGLQELSPQGQKRTIDEVGNDVGEATNSIGMPQYKRRKA